MSDASKPVLMSYDPQENEIFERLRAGDPDALVWFYRTYGQKMYF
jgi:hypothetical protein